MVLKQSYYNLYQTQLRRDIQTKVYHKESLIIHLFGKEYFCLVKSKKIGPLKLSRFQIMGVELPSDEEFVKQELARVRETYRANRGNISFQFGFINEIISFENVGMRESNQIQDIKQMRLNLRQRIIETYDLKLSFRENMPQSNILYFIDKTDEELLADMNSGAKEKVKNGFNKKVDFEIAKPEQYEEFYERRRGVAGKKGFSPITKQQLFDLMQFLDENDCGKMFLSFHEGEMIAGNICLFDDHHLVYLYGFSERGRNRYGGHHYLKFRVFQWGRAHGFDYCDMMGGAPTGFDDHPLAGVSSFKESLGGSKIELYGNYDLVLNSFLYKIFEKYTHRRGKH